MFSESCPICHDVLYSVDSNSVECYNSCFYLQYDYRTLHFHNFRIHIAVDKILYSVSVFEEHINIYPTYERINFFSGYIKDSPLKSYSTWDESSLGDLISKLRKLQTFA